MGDAIQKHNPSGPSISRQREYQRRHEAMGLCLYCPEESTRGVLCDVHYERHAINERNRYRKRHGLPPSFAPVQPDSRRES